MTIDVYNPVVQLCTEGTRAEFEHRIEDARSLYQQAWDAHTDSYEACVAAHYVARFQENPEEILRWNQLALENANAANDDSVRDFYPSLYLNLGSSYEALGNQDKAQEYYTLAAELGVIHQPD
ncbi:MAG TPA: tetratricopeptide repeat protein [Anaerolineales bacterium]|nr:tetratricopeptide repeat protein [Anaerolineales bacterium]